MDLDQIFMISTGHGLPPPSIYDLTLDDVAAMIRLAIFPPPAPFSTRVLDISTPLWTTQIDVRGNAQHWMIRTAEAALDLTKAHWLARFETEEAYQTIVSERTNPGFAGFYSSSAMTRRGLPMAVSKAKHDRRTLASYDKAVESWNHVFRSEGQYFYQQLLNATDGYAEATARFLSLVGMDIRHFKGAFSLHIMLMCGNLDAARFISNNDTLLAINYPGTPIIPGFARPSFNQEMMTVLCRDLYHSLPSPDVTAINGLLEGIVGAYINEAYDPPPFSYVRVESRDGGVYLHTKVLFGTAPRPPAARPFWVPLRQPVPAPGQVLLLADLFAQGAHGADVIASCTMVIESQTTNLDQIQVWLVRTDGGDPEQRLNLHQPHQVTVTTPPLGEQWQLYLRFPGVPPTHLFGTLQGHFWFTDSAGLESEHASWRISGDLPRAVNLIKEASLLLPVGVHSTIVADLFAFGVPGGPPLERGHIRINTISNNSLGTQIIMHRTDSLIGDIPITAVPGTTHDFVALPVGERWQLYVVGVNPIISSNVALFLGEIWFTDTGGNQSNRASVLISLTREP